VGTDRATRLARTVGRTGADLALSRATREARVQRVRDAWIRALSRGAVAATSRELRLERARIDTATTAAAKDIAAGSDVARAGDTTQAPRSAGPREPSGARPSQST
jgi:hypothetical protein